MSCPKSWLAGGACTLLVSFTTMAAPQTRFISGVVRTAEDQPVASTTVRIVGAGSTETSDSGEFEFPLSPPLKVGFPATFGVAGWVIIDPCVHARGRMYLPDPEAETISIKVLQPGDRRLLSGHSIGCIVKERNSQFEPTYGSAGGSSASTSGGNLPVFAREHSARLHDGGGSVALVQAAYHSNLSLDPFEPTPEERRDNTQQVADEFLAKQAKELGFTAGELTSAISEWANSVEDPYQKGLAALYERQYAEASRYISESIASSTGDILERYVLLARAEYEQGHYGAAEVALRKVLTVHSDDPLVLNDLGVVLSAEANYSEAEPLFKRALTIWEKALGPEHPNVASSLNNLAVLYRAQGRYTEAEPLYRRALAISEKALGAEHPKVAIDLTNLAGLYYAQGKYSEAEPLFKRALAISEKALGAEHPKVATFRNNLAGFYSVQGKFSEAEPLFKRALAINEKVLGAEHPKVAIDLQHLALLYYVQGNYSEAEPLFKRALAIDEKALGAEHPDVALDAANLARTLRKLGRDAEAKVYEDQAARIRAKKSQKPKAGTPKKNNHR